VNRASNLKVVTALTALLFSGVARAGVPFINLEGAGGVAFNPLAYAAADAEEGIKVGGLEIAKPRIGSWYVNLNDSSIDWNTIGGATSINKRLELSFGYESIAIGSAVNVHKENVGAKLVLLDENAFGTKYLPSVAVGGTWKNTTYHPLADGTGVDAYLVATKFVTELPWPVLLSAGALSTKAQVDGIIGFNADRKLIVFGNVDVVPLSWLAVGVEYKMGPNYQTNGTGYMDGDYFNVHAGWFVTKSFTLAAAYTFAGTNTFTAPATKPSLGFGPGFVLGGQYSF